MPAEVVLTFMFLMIHLIGIPVTNLSVNPARSTGPAVFVGGWAVQQLWLFWLAPVVGAALAGIAYPALAGHLRQKFLRRPAPPAESDIGSEFSGGVAGANQAL